MQKVKAGYMLKLGRVHTFGEALDALQIVKIAVVENIVRSEYLVPLKTPQPMQNRSEERSTAAFSKIKNQRASHERI